ncbi:MotE family protein [Devosia sp.]|uniref:MotE family protein n=1 Tax=Devosia sp. TaxID=1871048 RepID=UPI002EE50E7D
MRPVRLLPVVILSAAALLVFKGLGLVTTGGYMLTGTTLVAAAGGGGEGDAVAEMPRETLAADPSPTLQDTAPTVPLPGKDAEGAKIAPEVESAHGSGSAAAGPDSVVPGASAPCPPGDATVAAGHGAAGTEPARAAGDCAPGLAAGGDALPTRLDGNGNVVPLAGTAVDSQGAVIERLGERRVELEAREAEIEMRLALVEAAEKRIAERTTALEALEARVNALVEAKKASDDSQFNAIVAMYETMKPKEAAAIFDELEMPVLLRVASAVTPRKMALIMARMRPEKAKQLTASMASDNGGAGAGSAEQDLAALPQIVGQ